MLFCELPFFWWVLNSERRWHTQTYNFRYFIASVLLICMGRDHCWPYQCCCSPLIGWKLPAIALKVDHCWTLKTTVSDFWRQSPTCPADSVQLKYEYMRDSFWVARLLATVGDWSISIQFQFNSIQFKKGLLSQIHQYLQHTYIQVFCNNEGYWSKKCLLVPQWDVSLTNYLRDGIQYTIMISTTRVSAVQQVHS